jgi:hypothetical protein
MTKIMQLSLMVPLVCLAACDVQLQDLTPAEYPANANIGMYPIKARLEPGTLVSPSAVYVSVRAGDQTIQLAPDRTLTQWSALYPVRCQPTFPLQYRVFWTVQGVTARSALIPPQPRQIRLIEPPPTREARFDTSAKTGKGWEGVVQYRFQTAPVVHITSARIEPAGADAASVKAARPLSVLSEVPLEAPCGQPAELRIHSKSPQAHGTLVIETDHPAVPKWQTSVHFAPVTG